MDEKMKQRILVEKINMAAALIESNRTSSGNMLLSSKWVMDNIIGIDNKNSLRKYKIKKILDDKAGEI